MVFACYIRAVMKTAPKPTFKQKLWASLEPYLLILIRDIILFLIVLAALVIGFGGVAGMKVLGMPPERVTILETAHFYTYLTTFCIFALDMLFKIISLLIKEQSLKEKS